MWAGDGKRGAVFNVRGAPAGEVPAPETDSGDAYIRLGMYLTPLTVHLNMVGKAKF